MHQVVLIATFFAVISSNTIIMKVADACFLVPCSYMLSSFEKNQKKRGRTLTWHLCITNCQIKMVQIRSLNFSII